MQHSYSHYNPFRSIPAPIYARGNIKWRQWSSHSNAICNQRYKNRIELRRRTDEVPFIAGCSHFTRKNTRFRAPASSPTQSRCNIMQPFQCDLPPQLQEPHRTTHTGTSTRCKAHRRNNSRMKRPQPQPPHRRGTFHRRLQPLYTEKHKVSRSGFLPNSPLPLLTTSHHHHFPSSPLPIVPTSLPHHSPSSSLPFVLRHHFPSSPLPIVTTSHRHHLLSSTSLPRHFPSSPPPIVPTCLPHHSPSSSLPSVTTSLPHHCPSSRLPFLTTSRHHHFPSSPLPIVTTSLPHHFPSSPASFDYVSLDHAPPFIIVNSRASYSFVMCIVTSCTTLQYC